MLISVNGILIHPINAGTVLGWGDNRLGQQNNLPEGLSNVVAIAAGGSHSLALSSNGTVLSWGYNGTGLNNFPPGLSNVVSVSAGDHFSAVIKSDGTVVGWTWLGSVPFFTPPGLSNVTALACGYSHCVALKKDGTVEGWGDTNYDAVRQAAAVPSGLTGVVAVAANGFHSVALKSDGTMVAWGWNQAGESTSPISLPDVVSIAAGVYHNLALKNDGTVVAWGRNDSGESSVPAGLSNVVAIAAGMDCSFAVKSDGTMIAWGDNTYGQLDGVVGISNIVQISAMSLHGVALVENGNYPLRFRLEPKTQTVALGRPVIFRCLVSGAPPIGYSWLRDGVTIVPFEQGTSTLAISNASLTNSGSYSVVVTNAANPNPGLMSSNAVLTVSTSLPPSILSQPTNKIAPAGSSVGFSVTANGSPPLSFQWRFNGTNIAGATNEELILTSVQTASAGRYSVAVTSPFDSALSSDAILSVTPATPPSFQWAAPVGGAGTDQARGMAVDDLGNCYVTGLFSSNATFGSTTLTTTNFVDGFVAKCDTVGAWQWARKLGGTYGESIAVDNNGNICVTGPFTGAASLGSTNISAIGSTDVLVAKYDSAGTLLWAKQAGGRGGVAGGSGIAIDAPANIYVTGSFTTNTDFGGVTLASRGLFVAKYDPSGNLDWVRGAGGDDYGYAIDVDSAGNSAIAGYFSSTTSFGSTTLTPHPGGDSYVAGLNNEGDFLWAQQAWTDGGGLITANKVAMDGSGNSYVFGSFQSTAHFGNLTLSSASYRSAFLAKYDTAGVLQWVRQGGGPRGNGEGAVAVDGTGNSYVTGVFFGVVDLDGILLTSESGAGTYIIKYDTDGIIQWVQQFYGADSWAISLSKQRGVYAAGAFVGNAAFGDIILSNEGSSDIFVAKLVPKSELNIHRELGPFGDPQYRISLGSEYLSRYVIEISQDLLDWFPSTTVTNQTGSVEFIEQPNNTVPFRFYRAKPLY